MADQQTYERFWEEAAIRLLHPTQVLILEALDRLNLPLSATAMERMCDGQIALGNYAYHFTRLEKLGFIELVKTEPRRGALEKFYDLLATWAVG